MVTTIPASQARYGSSDQQIVYRDEKGYEIEFRKHDTSAFARDIWSFDRQTGKHQMLTTYKGGDHDPYVLDNSIYYLSEERTNHFNVWEMNSDGGKKRQITDFKTHPVRHLSVSNKNYCATPITDKFTLNKLAIHPNGLRWNSNRTADPTDTKQKP